MTILLLLCTHIYCIHFIFNFVPSSSPSLCIRFVFWYIYSYVPMEHVSIPPLAMPAIPNLYPPAVARPFPSYVPNKSMISTRVYFVSNHTMMPIPNASMPRRRHCPRWILMGRCLWHVILVYRQSHSGCYFGVRSINVGHGSRIVLFRSKVQPWK